MAEKFARAHSRIAQREQKKLTQQTVMMVIASVVIGAVFLTVLLPFLLRLFFEFLDKNSSNEVKDLLPPQIPIVESLPTATFSGKVKLTGFAEANSSVILLVDGIEANTLTVSADGKFEQELSLVRGQNQIELFSKDAAGNTSANTKTMSVVFDDEVPLLELEAPSENAIVELRKNQQLEVKGKTEVGSKLLLNDRLVMVKPDGTFQTTFYLNEGENNLVLVATDPAGNTTKLERKVTFKF